MSLTIRWNAGEGVLRSVGDAPNGILGLGNPGFARFSFFVDAGTQPEDIGVRVVQVADESAHAEHGGPPASKYVPLEDVVVGASGREELSRLWEMAAQMVNVVGSLAMRAPERNLEQLDGLVGWLMDLRDALTEEVSRRG